MDEQKYRQLVEQKLEEAKNQIRGKHAHESGVFMYWLGQQRILEWILDRITNEAK